jgi:hypothetical protein
VGPRAGRVRKISPSPRFDPRPVLPVASPGPLKRISWNYRNLVSCFNVGINGPLCGYEVREKNDFYSHSASWAKRASNL